jgi:hypothetical protein
MGQTVGWYASKEKFNKFNKVTRQPSRVGVEQQTRGNVVWAVSHPPFESKSIVVQIWMACLLFDWTMENNSQLFPTAGMVPSLLGWTDLASETKCAVSRSSGPPKATRP